MDTKELIKHHERCIAVLEMIESCEKSIDELQKEINFHKYWSFQNLFNKYFKKRQSRIEMLNYLKNWYNKQEFKTI